MRWRMQQTRQKDRLRGAGDIDIGIIHASATFELSLHDRTRRNARKPWQRTQLCYFLLSPNISGVLWWLLIHFNDTSSLSFPRNVWVTNQHNACKGNTREKRVSKAIHFSCKWVRLGTDWIPGPAETWAGGIKARIGSQLARKKNYNDGEQRRKMPQIWGGNLAHHVPGRKVGRRFVIRRIVCPAYWCCSRCYRYAGDLRNLTCVRSVTFFWYSMSVTTDCILSICLFYLSVSMSAC